IRVPAAQSPFRFQRRRDSAGQRHVLRAGRARHASGRIRPPSMSDSSVSASAPASITLVRPDDWHLHLRDGAALEAVVADTARQFARAIIMPNLKPPVTTTGQALAYRGRIEAALRKAGVAEGSFAPLMTLYLTDNTPADEIVRARESGAVFGVKLYPA